MLAYSPQSSCDIETIPGLATPHVNPETLTIISKQESSALDEHIDDLLAGKYAAKIFVEALNEKAKNHTLQWSSKPSLQKTLEWGKHALQRFWLENGQTRLKAAALGTFCISLGALCFHYAHQSNEFKFLELAQLFPRRLLTSIPQQMTSWFFVALCHEAGHTLMHYLANGHIPSIYLGADSLDIPSDTLEILPQVHLCGIDPTAKNYCTPLLLSDLSSIKAADRLNAKKIILHELALKYPAVALTQLQKSDEFNDKVALILKPQKRINHLKLAAIHAAGPLCDLVGNAVIKTMQGIPLTSLDLRDFAALNNLLPSPGSDGEFMIRDGFGLPGVAAKMSQFTGPICIVSTLGYLASMLHSFDVFAKMPTSLSDVAITCSSIFRTLGIAITNLGAMGFVHLTPEISE